MLFSAILILLVLAIAYFHYVQGFFGATISAILAVIAAVLAVSYHESLESLLNNGAFADSARAITLIALFAAIYLVLRLIFDAVVPGNIRLPVTLDRVGAAIMGLIAGIFATGVVALAAQTMPFGPSIAGYSLYTLQEDRAVTLPGAAMSRRQDQDAIVHGELKSDTFNPADRNAMILPMDSMVLATVAHLSNGGSLAGSNNFTAIHPDYLKELFGQRIGLQPAARHTATNGKAGDQVKLVGVYQVDHPLPKKDTEYSTARTIKGLDKPLTAAPGQMILVVRIVFNQNAAGGDKLVRFSPGSIHLVANGKDYFPVGTLEKGTELYVNKPDDFLFVDVAKQDQGADLVFVVDAADVKGASVAKESGAPTIRNGTFISVKRLARIDLSDKTIQSGSSLADTSGKDYEIQVLRKVGLDTPRRK